MQSGITIKSGTGHFVELSTKFFFDITFEPKINFFWLIIEYLKWQFGWKPPVRKNFLRSTINFFSLKVHVKISYLSEFKNWSRGKANMAVACRSHFWLSQSLKKKPKKALPYFGCWHSFGLFPNTKKLACIKLLIQIMRTYNHRTPAY